MTLTADDCVRAVARAWDEWHALRNMGPGYRAVASEARDRYMAAYAEAESAGYHPRIYDGKWHAN